VVLLDLDLPLAVTPAMVTPMRRLLEARLATALADDDAVFRVALTAHELLENAAKYASDGRARLRVQVGGSEAEDDGRARVAVSNRTTPQHIDALRALLAEMGTERDPLVHYHTLMRRNAKASSLSQLGLARIRAEGEMEIALQVEGEAVTVVASTQLTNGRRYLTRP
jgi:hypothetical protein